MNTNPAADTEQIIARLRNSLRYVTLYENSLACFKEMETHMRALQNALDKSCGCVVANGDVGPQCDWREEAQRMDRRTIDYLQTALDTERAEHEKTKARVVELEDER